MFTHPYSAKFVAKLRHMSKLAQQLIQVIWSVRFSLVCEYTDEWRSISSESQKNPLFIVLFVFYQAIRCILRT